MTRITLRPLTVDDASAMAEVLADPSLYHYIGGEPPSVEQLERRYAAQVVGRSPDGRERWVNSVVMRGAEPIGYVQATIPLDGAPTEVSWVIGRPWQGQGNAQRAAQLLVEELVAQGVSDLVAHIHPGHHASERVARSLGMHPTDVVVDGEIRWVSGR